MPSPRSALSETKPHFEGGTVETNGSVGMAHHGSDPTDRRVEVEPARHGPLRPGFDAEGVEEDELVALEQLHAGQAGAPLELDERRDPMGILHAQTAFADEHQVGAILATRRLAPLPAELGDEVQADVSPQRADFERHDVPRLVTTQGVADRERA